MITANPDELVEAAARAVVRGSLLFHLELAQLLALDALPGGLAVGGWAVDLGANGYEVTFLDTDLAREIYGVTFAAGGQPLGEPRRGRANPRLAALAEGRRTALGQISSGEDWSAVVLPPAAGARPGAAPTAYLLQRGVAPGDTPMDGHLRMRLSPDGRRVLSAEPVTSERVPSEAIVYLSLKQGLALELATPASGSRWRVDGESVTRL